MRLYEFRVGKLLAGEPTDRRCWLAGRDISWRAPALAFSPQQTLDDGHDGANLCGSHDGGRVGLCVESKEVRNVAERFLCSNVSERSPDSIRTNSSPRLGQLTARHSDPSGGGRVCVRASLSRRERQKMVQEVCRDQARGAMSDVQ